MSNMQFWSTSGMRARKGHRARGMAGVHGEYGSGGRGGDGEGAHFYGRTHLLQACTDSST
jgi:hypothetical protein